MNVKRFTARTSREALALVRQAFGDDAVVMSTRPCAEGVEVLAMAPESVQQLERIGAQIPLGGGAVAGVPAPAVRPQPNIVQPRQARAEAAPERRAAVPVAPAPRGTERLEPRFDAESPVAQDVEQLEMSTLSFQDYVRQRMLKRREAQLAADGGEPVAAAAIPPAPALSPAFVASMIAEAPAAATVTPPVAAPISTARSRLAAREPAREGAARGVPVLREELRAEPVLGETAAPAAALRAEQMEMLGELRSMRGLIEQRFGALAFMEKMQRHPRQAHLAQRLLDTGFSPALIRRLVEGLPNDVEEMNWASGVLERNLATGERESPLEEQGGVYALVGATGVGKTTSTAKLAAAFAARHGAAELGLVTLDAYRVAAHEQLRTYGRILGVPVHTAHDRASLEDLLDLLSGKRMVLIDTAGMAQRDTRTRELLEMLSHRSINRLLVLNASAQGETIEDQLGAYAASACKGVVLSKLDEAVKLGPAIDAVIRHKLKVLAVANGQRVPEDWHRLSAKALVTRALKGGGSAAWRLDDQDVNLVFAGMPALRAGTAAGAAI